MSNHQQEGDDEAMAVTIMGTREARQLIHDIEQMDQRICQMQTDIQEMQRQKEGKKQQLQILRRKLLLTSIEHCHSPAAVRKLWHKMEPAEQQDEEIVCQILANSGSSSDVGHYDGLYGHNPWRKIFRDYRIRHALLPTLPGHLLDNPKLAYAFVKNRRHLDHDFIFPCGVRDDKEFREMSVYFLPCIVQMAR
jgi:hypothetical protein